MAGIGNSQVPNAAVQPVIDNYFGTDISDPYRWMEDLGNPMLREFLEAQENLTAKTLADLTQLREQFRRRIAILLSDTALVSSTKRVLDNYFFLETPKGEDIRCLFARGTKDSRRHLLLDPTTLGPPGGGAAIDFFQPSWDARYVIVGISLGGSENSTLRIIETATGIMLSEAISRTQYAMPSWAADSKSFYYARLQSLPSGAPASAVFEDEKVYHHILGTNPEEDNAIFGPGVFPDVDVPKAGFSAVRASPEGGFLLAGHSRGTVDSPALWSMNLRAKPAIWRSIVSKQDLVTSFATSGTTCYATTKKQAPRGRIIYFDVLDGTAAETKEVRPETALVLTSSRSSGLISASDGLYYYGIRNGLSELYRIAFGNSSRIINVDLPFGGSVFDLCADPRKPGITFTEDSWLRPRLIYHYDPKIGKTVDTGLTKATTTGLSAFASSEVEATSSDGVMVPLSIIYRKDLALDGSHPTLLNVYGAYGVSITPDFRPEALAWLERGGVLAYGHVRGGGEKGEKWHREGMLAKKQNSIDDTVACAQYLIAQNYTSAKCLSVEGTSAGGIAVGGAIVQHPELFRAGVIRGGVLDLLRFEQTQGGSANIPEFGSVKTLEGFRSLQQVSPYANVKSGTAYPAILLEAGVNDSRVPMWQSAKMTAKLQAATSSTLPILLRVDRAGGHYLGSVKGPLIDWLTDKYTFLIWHLCPDQVFRSVDPER